jgi:hypothetical protein
MKEAYRLTREDGVPGIDGVTADDYATNLEANLLDRLDSFKLGRYVAPPVRRTYIPKTDGSQFLQPFASLCRGLWVASSDSGRPSRPMRGSRSDAGVHRGAQSGRFSSCGNKTMLSCSLGSVRAITATQLSASLRL